MWYALVFFLVLATLGTTTKGIEVDFNETIEAPAGFIPTSLLANPDGFQELLDICVASPSCAEHTGQSVTQNLETFIHIIQVTSPFLSDPPYVESGCVDFVFNQTLQEVCDEITRLRIENALLKSNLPCGLNERLRLSGDLNDTLQCEPLPGRAQTDNIDISSIAIFVLVAAFVLMIVVVVKKAYLMWIHSRSKVAAAKIS
jgi:hypothetical protein